MTQVNLIPEKSRLNIVRLALVKRVKNASLIILVIFIIWGGIVAAANWYLNSQINLNSKRIDLATKTLQEFTDEIAVHNQARAQVTNAAEVISDRKILSPMIEATKALMGEGVYIKNILYDQKTLVIKGSWPEIIQINEFEQKVYNALDDLEFQSTTLDQISIKENRMEFTIIFVLGN